MESSWSTRSIVACLEVEARPSSAHALHGYLVANARPHHLVHVLHHLRARDEKAAALRAHGPALDLHHGQRIPGEAAEEIGKEARCQITAGKLQGDGGVGL